MYSSDHDYDISVETLDKPGWYITRYSILYWWITW